MDLTVAKYSEANLSRSSVIITSVQNCHPNKFIVILEGNGLSFYSSVRIDHLLLSVAVEYLEAPHPIIIRLNDHDLFNW